MYRNVWEYVAALERAGELVRVAAEVDPVLEIAELTDRESKRPRGGRALLFERTGTSFPVLTNMMGSDRRIALALGVESLDDLTRRIESLFSELTAPKTSLSDKLRMLPLLERMSRWLPRNRRGRGACQQVVRTGDEVRLSELPVLKCWPFDGGRFVTFPLVHTVDPESGVRNVGMYRMQVFSERSTGMHWHVHKTGEKHYRAYRRLGRRMPVAVCLGGDPAYAYAATAPMPDDLDEYLLAGFLRGRPVELVRCLTCDLRVPADCDFVIEGYVDPSEEKAVEGPFGDHTGFYSLEDLYPVFHVTAITRRRDAVYPATIVGVPPQEDAYIAKATERIFLAPIRRAMLPEADDLWMPWQGVAHNIAVANIRTAYPGQGLKTASSLWGAGQMMFNKFLLVVSTPDDVRQAGVLASLLRRVRLPEQALLSRGPLDVLDHASPQAGLGGKMAVDLTGVSPEDVPAEIRLPDRWEFCCGVTSVDCSLAETWGALVLFAGRSAEVDAEGFVLRNEVQGVSWVVVMDAAAEEFPFSDRLWLAAAACDPSRDVRLSGGMAFFDARTKAGGVRGFARRWPNVVASSPETIARVDDRWAEYGLGECVESPSLRYLKLQERPGAEF